MPWYGRVVTTKGEKVYVDSGKNGGMHVGDLLDVLKADEPLIDPETGINLGSEVRKVGQIQVIQVADKFSIATPITGGGFERGDLLKFRGSAGHP